LEGARLLFKLRVAPPLSHRLCVCLNE
jgi:hypothetical protein